MTRLSGMRVSPPVAILGIFAALSGWLVRGIRFDVEASPVPAPISQPSPAVEFEPPLRVDEPVHGSYAGRSMRNLFAYAEREIPVITRAVLPPQPVITEAPPPVPAPTPVAERPRARFTHRYIGRFGPDHRPIAAFARDGEILTVRVGERIDDRFILRSIGIESVEVEANVDGEVQSERITLDGAL